jgi:DNA-binding beta-propeller fold protein YncE
VAAGCSPVRLVTDQSNKTYVSARSQNEIIVLDNKSLLSKTSQSPVVSNVPVGPAPVGIKLARNNTVLVVASSNRFDPNGYGQINLIDTRTNMLNTLPALKFPREIAVSPDGNTAVVTNYSSDSLEVIHLPTLGY